MSKTDTNPAWMPEWFTPEEIDTVIIAFPDVYGRLLGKRITREHFINHTVQSGTGTCNYLLVADMNMNTQEGFKLASWEQGYGDFQLRPELKTLRRLPWYEKTAVALGDLYHENGALVDEAPRSMLANQLKRLAERGLVACAGSEPEFFLFQGNYRTAAESGYRDLAPASSYQIDYHILQPGRDENVLRRIRNEMSEAGITIECSKGECGNGQHEVNLLYTEAMEMADRHVVYVAGCKEIADQEEHAITFMAKWSADHTGSSCHVHQSIWDAERKHNLFHDEATGKESELFRQFLGGLMKYTRELTYFFAPTINSYKRYQPGSWAPTRVVWSHDNRTCGYRVVGEGDGLRIENRIPGADANPYLAFAAMLAAGLQGVEEKLGCGDPYRGNAYDDESLPRVPRTLAEAGEILARSKFARTTFGDEVVELYAHTAELEAQAFQSAVTDWERRRYFEQI